MESQRSAFGTVLFGGFNKAAVYQYIEQLVTDHETVCKRYEHQKTDLENELRDLQRKNRELDAECAKLREENAALQAETEALKKQQEIEE